MTIQKLFYDYVRKITQYDEALGVLHWDLRTGAPAKTAAHRSAVIGMLSSERFRMTISDEMKRYLDELAAKKDQLDDTTLAMLREWGNEYERSVNIPVAEYEDYVRLTSEAESFWETAKEAADFAGFRPYLEKIVAYKRKFAEYWGYKEHPYDSMLDAYEPGLTVAQLDPLFQELRSHLIGLLDKKNSAFVPSELLRNTHFDGQKQREFSLYILSQMGYDFAAGRLDNSTHPFAIGLNPGDVRITTNYRPDDITFALFSSIHEGGHALYEQRIHPNLYGTGLDTGASMGMHEAMSRFWENRIGRSLAFWERYYPELQNMFPEVLRTIELEDFYRSINAVEPSLIRIEADELTYSLHIIIRYELEKAMIEGSLGVKDLPEAWNAKYKDYLGVTPTHDGEGVLQDVHWSGGDFGYFPSYALGNLYASQLEAAMMKDLGDLNQIITGGHMIKINDWLEEHIYQHGMVYTPHQLITKVTGEKLKPDHFVHYLSEKYV